MIKRKDEEEKKKKMREIRKLLKAGKNPEDNSELAPIYKEMKESEIKKEKDIAVKRQSKKDQSGSESEENGSDIDIDVEKLKSSKKDSKKGSSVAQINFDSDGKPHVVLNRKRGRPSNKEIKEI
jgi:hypothetical protein